MRQKTETMLCVAFMELLKKCPFSKITIQKLAGQCGVNRQTFYYHFDNIYDLMSKAFEYELVHESRIYEEVTYWVIPIVKKLIQNSSCCFIAGCVLSCVKDPQDILLAIRGYIARFKYSRKNSVSTF